MVNYQLNQLVVKAKTAIFPVESEDSGNELKSKVSPLSNKHFLNATYWWSIEVTRAYTCLPLPIYCLWLWRAQRFGQRDRGRFTRSAYSKAIKLEWNRVIERSELKEIAHVRPQNRKCASARKKWNERNARGRVETIWKWLLMYSQHWEL